MRKYNNQLLQSVRVLLHPKTINRPIDHGFGNFQQVPDGKHHGPVCAFQVVTTLIGGGRGTAQQVGDIELGVFEAHVVADVVEPQFIRCRRLLASQLEIDCTVKS